VNDVGGRLNASESLKKAIHLRNTESAMNSYTNAALTVIAFALVALVVENAISPARAQFPSPMRVVICDASDISKCATVHGQMLPAGIYLGQLAVKN